jgi:hypothetical protein
MYEKNIRKENNEAQRYQSNASTWRYWKLVMNLGRGKQPKLSLNNGNMKNVVRVHTRNSQRVEALRMMRKL